MSATQRIAILSDIHANSLALDAVLADIAAQGVDGYWVLGDLVALGPDPLGVLERLSRLPETHILRGNTDRYAFGGDQPLPELDEVRAHPELLEKHAHIAATFAWTQGALQVSGWYDWLAALPLELQFDLPDGSRVLAVHASPGADDGPGIRPDSSQADLAKLMEGCQADLICVGHTHYAYDLRFNGQRLVNPGSLSNPHRSDLRASYAILDAGPDGYEITHRRVDYDRQRVIATLQAMRHPGAHFIVPYLQGLVD